VTTGNGIPEMDEMTSSNSTLRAAGLAGALVCLTVLAGCAKPSNPEDMLPPIPRANPGPVSPDGTYNGNMSSNGSSGAIGDCGNGDDFTLNVRNSKFSYVLPQPNVPYRRQVRFDATVAPDGSFDSGSGGTYMRGRFGQGHMSGQIVGDACSFDMEADRTGTW
jgi:hypothetical protein